MKNLATLVFLLVINMSYSQSISTDAPSISAGATVVGSGIFQIESRLQYSELDGLQTLQIPSNLFRLGLGDKFELRMTNGITKLGKLTSIDQMSLGFKAQLLNKSGIKTQVAFLFSAVLPNFKTNFYSGSSALAVNHNIGEKNSIGYNVGFSYSSLGPAGSSVEFHSILGSLIYSHAFTNRFSLFSEFYGEYNHNTTLKTETSSINFDCGFLYLISDKFQVDYSYGLGISNEDSFHAIGFNYRIGPRK